MKMNRINLAISVFVVVAVTALSYTYASADIVKKSLICSNGGFQVSFDTKTGTVVKGEMYGVSNDSHLESFELWNKYYGSQEIIIPSKIQGVKVRTIGKCAFKDCDTLKSVQLPDTVRTIGKEAFAGTYEMVHIGLSKNLTFIGNSAFRGSGIQSITIPSKVKKIGSRVFYRSMLEDVTFSAGLKEIGNEAFMFTNIVKVYIPKNVTSIKYNAFRGCYALESIIVNKKNTKYSSAKGVLFDKKKTRIICYPMNARQTKYLVPRNVKKLSYTAFTPANVENLVISRTVTSISDGALSGVQFENFVVNKNNKNYSSHNGVIYNKKRTKLIRYPRNRKNSKFTVPKTVTAIAYPAICEPLNLTELNIPSTVKMIEGDAVRTFESGTTIYCKNGSAAQEYCNMNGLNYVDELDRPVLSAESLGNREIKFTWTQVDGATKYFLSCYNPEKNKFIRISTKKNNSAIIKIEKTGLLHFKVRAYHSLGSERLYSPFSKVISVAVE